MDEALRAQVRRLEELHDVTFVAVPKLHQMHVDYAQALGIRWWFEGVSIGDQMPLLVIQGPMGSGKSTVLEVISHLCPSFRTRKLVSHELSRPPTLFLLDGPRPLINALQALRNAGHNLAMIQEHHQAVHWWWRPLLAVDAAQVSLEVFRRWDDELRRMREGT